MQCDQIIVFVLSITLSPEHFQDGGSQDLFFQPLWNIQSLLTAATSRCPHARTVPPYQTVLWAPALPRPWLYLYNSCSVLVTVPGVLQLVRLSQSFWWPAIYLPTSSRQRMSDEKKKRFKNENTVEVETAGVVLQSTPVSDSARHVDSLSNERKHLEDSLLSPNRGCWAREEGKMSLPKFSRRMQSSVGVRASPDSSLSHAYSPFHVFPLVSAQRWDFRYS